MKELIKYFQSTFYTDAAVFLVSIIGLVISYLVRNQNELKIFRVLFAGHIISRSLNYLQWKLYYGNSHYYKFSIIISNYGDFLLTILEYFVLTFYLKKYINKNKILACTIFFLTCIIISYYNKYILMNFKMDSFLFTSQAVAILTLCAFYYSKLFKSAKIKLTDEPSFWVVTGFSIFMLSTFPYSIMCDYLYSFNEDLHFNTFSLFHFFYIILFSMIIKAYLCPQIPSK